MPTRLRPHNATVLRAPFSRVVSEGEAEECNLPPVMTVGQGGLTPGETIYAFDNPERRGKQPWMAAAEAFGINMLVLGFDRYALDAEFARVTFSTMRHNVKTGFVWDNDQFSTNLFAHPYHGGLYFNAARSNGMNFWESVPYAFCGSLMWETLCETEPPAINDLIATTVGGVCIGEVTSRISDLIYDDRQRGFGRFAREFLGALVCPIKALNRIVSGDAWRVRTSYYKYHDYERLPVSFNLSAGYRYLADDNAMFRGESNPYVNVNLTYGDPFDESTNKPYDYFTADITFGLSSNQPLISGVHLLGQLWSAPVYTGNDMQAEFGLFQHFNYYDSQPVKDGTSMVPFRISEAASVGGSDLQVPADRQPHASRTACLHQRNTARRLAERLLQRDRPGLQYGQRVQRQGHNHNGVRPLRAVHVRCGLLSNIHVEGL